MPLAKFRVGALIDNLRRKAAPPPKSAADLGFLKKDLGRLGRFFGGGEAKAAEMQVTSIAPLQGDPCPTILYSQIPLS